MWCEDDEQFMGFDWVDKRGSVSFLSLLVAKDAHQTDYWPFCEHNAQSVM